MTRCVASPRRRTQRGQAVVEFTLVGTMLIFVLISTFEMARSMWVYSMLAHAVKEGSRYAAMRGYYYNRSCVGTTEGVANPSLCTLDVQKVAQVISNAGPGLVSSDVISVQMTANGVTLSCPDSNQSLQSCLGASSPSTFDVANNMSVGSIFQITAQYRVSTVFSTITTVFTVPTLPASAEEIVQF
jgi:Flp pilus assembly protein TadG